MLAVVVRNLPSTQSNYSNLEIVGDSAARNINMEGYKMKLGVFMMPLHPPDKDRTECFEEDIDLIVLADELGFTEAWIGQHHTVAWEPHPI